MVFGDTDACGEGATVTLEGEGKRKLYLRRKLTAVTSVTEDDVALAATDYKVWGAQGTVERLPRGIRWGEEIAIVYTPANDNDTRKAVIIDLVRLALERTALKSESIAGEYSYSAPEWEAERTAVLNRLALPAF